MDGPYDFGEDVFVVDADGIDRIWAVEYTAVSGKRMVEVLGTEGAARQVAGNRVHADPALLVYGAHLISRIVG